MSEDLSDVEWESERTFQPLRIVRNFSPGTNLIPAKQKLNTLLPDTVPVGKVLEIEIYARLRTE